MIAVEKMLSFKIKVRDININVSQNIHAEVVHKSAPRKVCRVVDLIPSVINSAKDLRTCQIVMLMTNGGLFYYLYLKRVAKE